MFPGCKEGDAVYTAYVYDVYIKTTHGLGCKYKPHKPDKLL
jgi:hypothetical protein